MKRQLCALSFFGGLAVALCACQQEGTGSAPGVQSGGVQSSPTPTTPQNSLGQSTAPQGSGQLPKGDTTSSAPAASTSAPNTSSAPSTSSSESTSQSTQSSSSSSTSSSGTQPSSVPAPYAGQKNPLPGDDTGAIVAGGLRYKKNCGCHVPESKHHNPNAPDLGREPYSKLADDWLLWKISEGVPPNMGPFKDTFNETERWQIITYLRALAVKNQQG